MTGETKQDDSIIELTDVVEDGQDSEEILSDDILSDDEIPEDSAIELTDIDDFNDVEMDPEPDVEEIGMEDTPLEGVSLDESSGDELTEDDLTEDDLTGDELTEDESTGDLPFSGEAVAADQTSDSGDTPIPEQFSVSDEQIEAALERVIEKKFAEKIDPLLFDTMERVILQEIKKLKTALLKDMDQIGPF